MVAFLVIYNYLILNFFSNLFSRAVDKQCPPARRGYAIRMGAIYARGSEKESRISSLNCLVASFTIRDV